MRIVHYIADATFFANGLRWLYMFYRIYYGFGTRIMLMRKNDVLPC